TFEKHVEHLKAIFSLIKNANLQINPEKCHFCTNEMQFLRYIVSINGIKPDSQKTEEHNRIFNYLKQCLITAPILQYPDYNEPFIIFIDASYQGLGAILFQVKDGKKYVIAYASRTLTSAEKNYSTVELE
ncbi:6890_t:CDS:2, partial [Racocetra fulgida]